MSQQLELLTENSSQWSTVSYVTPEIQKKEIKPFVILAIKELEGNPDSRTSSLMNADKFAAVRAVVRHLARLRSATKPPWRHDDVITFLEGLRFSQECVSELAFLLCVDKIYENIPTHLRVKPGLVGMQWKIDLSLCQANLAGGSSAERVLASYQRDARVTLVLSPSAGRRRAWRLSQARLHELRHGVARALRALLALERGARPA